MLSEHHVSDDGYLPSPIPVAAAFAAVTERIPISIAALLVNLYDPLGWPRTSPSSTTCRAAGSATRSGWATGARSTTCSASPGRRRGRDIEERIAPDARRLGRPAR